MKKLLILAMIILTATTYSIAAEKKPIKKINTDAFTNDTQVILKGTGDNHMALAWWIPNEFWGSILSRDTKTHEANKKAMLDTMSGVSLLAIAQADISSLGAFSFYSKEEIEKKILISYTDAGGKKQRLLPMQTINPNLEIVLGAFKPILVAAMGNFGNNVHFYVLNDKSKTSPRLLNPYRKGILNIQLAKRNGDLMNADIEMPLNLLFVPRKCPNGKDAHISWNYCPWTGKRLED